MKDVGGAGFAGSSPPFLGRERAAVDVDVGPERHNPRYHETCLAQNKVTDDDVYTKFLRETLVCINKTAMRHKRGECNRSDRNFKA